MKILVTGATGFVGSHLIPALLSQGHEITVLSRSHERLVGQSWHERVRFVAHEIKVGNLPPDMAELGQPDILIHLAWPGLPNYKGLFHVEENLPADYAFIKALVAAGLPRVLVTGTCLEYGLQEGCLAEDCAPAPCTPYGLAKDILRRSLEMLARQYSFHLTWVRLFYMYGPGQNPRSLLAQLDQAIADGASAFNMSGGEQLRDFLKVQEVANILAAMANSTTHAAGVYNCCSGQPVSVRELVENHLKGKEVTMRLNLGHYPYPDYEPMAFWGDTHRLLEVIKGVNHVA